MGLLTVTAADLLAREIPEVRSVVAGILPVGLTLLAGRPKIGKSWLALNLAVAVSGGGTFLDRHVDSGDVLYLALEDGDRRLQDRLRRMLQERPVPRTLHLATECRAIGDGGEVDIRDWCRSVQAPRLIVVDVLQRIRPKGERGARLYADDYAATLPLKAIADELELSVLVVTHCRKGAADEDPLDAVSATTGLTGAADHVLILDRASTGTILYGRGRDAEEVELAMRFDGVLGTWEAVGDREEVNRSDTRNAILAALRAGDKPMGPAEIALASGVAEMSVKKRIAAMVKAGEVSKLSRGLYVPSSTPVTSVTSVTFPSPPTPPSLSSPKRVVRC